MSTRSQRDEWYEWLIGRVWAKRFDAALIEPSWDDDPHHPFVYAWGHSPEFVDFNRKRRES